MTFKQVHCLELENFIQSIVVYKSCKEIYIDSPSSASGVYDLESGRHYCLMEKSTNSCGEGGWTLALKVDGTKVGQKQLNPVIFINSASLILKLIISSNSHIFNKMLSIL